MQIKISAQCCPEVSMATMETGVLYVVKRAKDVDLSYPEGSIVYKDENRRMILFNHNTNRIIAFTNPAFYPTIELEKYKKPLVLEN
jgi:hypothetical protein